MPGEAPEDALDAAAVLSREGRGTVFTQLGENLTRLEEAEAVRDHYFEMFDKIRERGIPGQISVKPTQLGLDLSREACAAHLRALAAKAEATGSLLWIDMEDSSYVDRTLQLYFELKPEFPSTGIAIQAYLLRTPADIERLLPLRPTIRLVKGAYAEPSHIAFPDKRDTDFAYFDLAVRLLESAAMDECLPIFGTHDIPMLGRIIKRAGEIGVPDGKYEIHMLYGIREADQRRLRSEGHVVKTLIRLRQARGTSGTCGGWLSGLPTSGSLCGPCCPASAAAALSARCFDRNPFLGYRQGMAASDTNARRAAMPLATTVRRILLFMSIAATSISAQAVHGTVVLGDSATVARAVIVLATDERGATVGRALTGDRGEGFTLALPGAGRFGLQVLRIGFRPTLVPPFAVEAHATANMRIVLTAAAVPLAAVNVRAQDECRVNRDSGAVGSARVGRGAQGRS